jgi:prophage regulatory protein
MDSNSTDGLTISALLRMDQVRKRTGLSRSTIYERIKLGRFPQPIRLGARSVAWIESEITAWLWEQVANSRPQLKIQK